MINNKKKNQQYMFVTLIDTSWRLLVSSPRKSCQLPATTSGKKTGRKLVRVISADSIYRCILLFLDHILYRRAHFVREVCSLLKSKQVHFTTNLDVSKNCWMSGNQYRLWSDAAKCGNWSGSTLFAQACLSQYVGVLRYFREFQVRSRINNSLKIRFHDFI